MKQAPAYHSLAAARATRLLPFAAALVLLATIGCGSSHVARTRVLLPPDQVKHTDAVVTPLDALNTSENEFGVAMPLDTTSLYFTSDRGSRQRIYVTRWSHGTWKAPVPAVEIDNGMSNGVPSLAPGGETMFFAGGEYGFGDCDIYRADIGPRGTVPNDVTPWSVPINLGMKVNGAYWDSEPCLSADGSTLYFSSDRPGGLGGRDIWACHRHRGGAWDAPVNLGEPVNTSSDEVTPWISPDGHTLLFSSNGHPGLGGFDVFTTSSSGGRTHVEHLGTPVNSDADDICFSLSSDGRHAFLASNRAGGRGGFDIYQVSPAPVQTDPVAVVHGFVHDAAGGPLPATIEVADLASNQVLGSFLSDPESGAYTLVLARGYDYGITALAIGHLFQSRHLTVRADLERDIDQRIDFSLAPATGTTELLVFFGPGKSLLLRESMIELDRVISFMLDNPAVHVEIAGHTDNSGDEAANLVLSRQRAQAVKSYLVANRIAADRVTVVGYGAAQPIADNSSEEGRARNRRVDLRVLGGDGR